MVKAVGELTPNHSGDLLDLRYVYVREMVSLAGNAKLHADERILASIQQNGFRDPAAWDSAVNALVEGNGRLSVLQQMISDKLPPPRGIKVDDKGEWLMPVLFGCDAKSVAQAKRYAIDHNMTVAFGGGFGVEEVAKMYDPEALGLILSELEADEMPASLISGSELEESLGLVSPPSAAEPELQLGSPDSFNSAPATAQQAKSSAATPSNTSGADDDLMPPPLASSSVRMLQLFLNVETHPKMMQMLEVLMPKYNTSNPTDCIFAIVAAAFEEAEDLTGEDI